MTRIRLILILWTLLVIAQDALSEPVDSVVIQSQLAKISFLESTEGTTPRTLSQAYTDLAEDLIANHQFQEARKYIKKSID
ncbi:MAG: hypothetical protein RJQ14_08255, partial [Marinoscillum sp.]